MSGGRGSNGRLRLFRQLVRRKVDMQSAIECPLNTVGRCLATISSASSSSDDVDVTKTNQ
jgi:hypothetical protein